jgi:hypothetical protein
VKRYFAVFLFLSRVFLCPAELLGQQGAWHPAQALLMTRWAARVTATNVLAEYPRPQMVRPQWFNLNGLWNYAITPTNAPPPTEFDGKILVPFPIESALSGVMTPLDAKSTLWYERAFSLPSRWAGKRILLHFGAVDWAVRVLVNGHEIGEHQGGYDAFTFDLTPQSIQAGANQLLVAVFDPTEGDQPRGKQSAKPEGIFYTQVSGVWQTVWLEPVPEISVAALQMTPDLPAKALRLRVNVSSLERDLIVDASAAAAGVEAGHVTGNANTDLLVPITSPRPWTPEDPFLYDLTVRLLRNGREVDRVTSYFGMRSVELRKAPDGFTRIALNGRPIFQIGALDQGFWPDGLYTAPTDEALRHDIEFLKSSGFNLVRKHVKVEPERWYYWCDRLGLLVWQDMPSANNNTRAGRAQFEAELMRIISGLQNHPAIIMWVLFNEGWGQYDTEQLVDWMERTDPSRLVDNASGWTDAQTGHVVDSHSYPDPDAPAPEDRRASILGECGGLGLVTEGHAWPQPWAYQMLPDVSSLQGWYSHVLKEIELQRHSRGLCAAVYTQVTDVENECNGLMTYDRAVTKLAPDWLAAVNSGREQKGPWKAVLTNALFGTSFWDYTFDNPGVDWFRPEFKELTPWRQGAAGFGTAFTRGSRVQTTWETPNIWLRKTFTLEAQDLGHARLQLHHDKDAEVYLNGVLAFSGKGYLVDYALFDMTPDAAASLRPGRNTIAVHCRQTAGGQFIDVGIIVPATATNALSNP